MNLENRRIHRESYHREEYTNYAYTAETSLNSQYPQRVLPRQPYSINARQDNVNRPAAISYPAKIPASDVGIYPTNVPPEDNDITNAEREGKSPLKKKSKSKDRLRRKCWNVFTRILSVILVISEIVLDWLQYADVDNIVTELRNDIDIETNLILGTPPGNCTHAKEYGEYYLYFTIFGTFMNTVQIANIIYQIYSECKKDKRPKKLLDGRTEVMIKYIFEELPQILLAARIENICRPSCSVNKMQRRRIITLVNRLTSFVSQAWRSLTSFQCCEYECESTDTGCCSNSCCCCCCCLLCELPRYFNKCLWICGYKWECSCSESKCVREETTFDMFFFVCTWCPEDDHNWIECCTLCCCCENYSEEPFVVFVWLSQILNTVYGFCCAMKIYHFIECEEPQVYTDIVNSILDSVLFKS